MEKVGSFKVKGGNLCLVSGDVDKVLNKLFCFYFN